MTRVAPLTVTSIRFDDYPLRSISAQRRAHKPELPFEARALLADRKMHAEFPALERGQRTFLRLRDDASGVLARQQVS
jgi:hypothetical protein